MKAVQVSQFGPPSVLRLIECPDPVPGPGEVAIDVSHASVGLVDLFFRAGQFKDMQGMAQPPFVPGLEAAGRVRALGAGVTEFQIGERVVSMSAGSGTGGYASIFIAPASVMISLEKYEIDLALAVSVIPNAAMAHVALTKVACLKRGESVLIHGALGGFSSGFPGIAKLLGASRIVGTVRSSKLEAAAKTKLPYDRIVDSSNLSDALADEKFDVVINPIGGSVSTNSLALMKPGGRLIIAGNASGDWGQSVNTNDIWLANATVLGFNAGAYMSKYPEVVRPALEAARRAVADGVGFIELDLLPFEKATLAHERMESRKLNGRIVLTPAE